MTVGFKKGRQFEEIKDDYLNFCLASAFGIHKGEDRKRVPIDKSTSCTIL